MKSLVVGNRPGVKFGYEDVDSIQNSRAGRYVSRIRGDAPSTPMLYFKSAESEDVGVDEQRDGRPVNEDRKSVV